MRLRYLRVAGLPPLHDVELTFGRNQILERACTIHFVVGVNGSGKTRLLQVLADLFTALAWQRWPSHPLTVAYDLGAGDERRTILIHRPPGSADDRALVEFKTHLSDRSAQEWRALAESDWKSDPLPGKVQEVFTGGALPGTGSIERYLPLTIAYTSGAVESWRALFVSEPEGIDAELPAYTAEEPVEFSTYLQPAPVPEDVVDPRGLELFRNLSPEIQERMEMRVPLLPRRPAGAILVEPSDLKLALCAVTLQQTARDFSAWNTPDERAAYIESITDEQPHGSRRPGLRGLLNEVDWLWPVSLSLTIRYTPLRWEPPVVALVRDLYRQAATVISEPTLPIRRLVFDLMGPVVQQDERGKPLEELADAVNCADALSRILGRTGRGESVRPFDLFQQLHRWRAEGWLLDVEMIVQKRNPDDLLRYEWLSDGERVFLGRTALFQLLAGQDDALFLLDEPETHFNDIWKREIVDIIDDSLRGDASEVMIATHSSIALTDVFDEEIELLRKEDGRTVVGRISTPTFGTDPSEIMIRVFGATDSIGKRALEYLDRLLEQEWRPEQREELERLIQNIGPGYHRSELRTILRRLDATRD